MINFGDVAIRAISKEKEYKTSSNNVCYYWTIKDEDKDSTNIQLAHRWDKFPTYTDVNEASLVISDWLKGTGVNIPPSDIKFFIEKLSSQ